MTSDIAAARGRLRPTTRTSLHAGSAIAAVLALSMPAAAFAQAEACGPLVNGAVTCPVAPDLHPEGVSYVIDAPIGAVTVSLESGAEIASQGAALTVINPFGNVTINAQDAHAVTSADESIGILASAGQGAVSVNVAGVGTYGTASHAVVAFADEGDVVVNANEIYTFGHFSTGISAVSNAGDVSVNVGQLSTYRTEAVGISALAYDGDINIDVGYLYTEGAGSTGIEAVNITEDGQTTINVDNVYTAGDGGVGVHAEVVNAVTVTGDSIMTEANQAHAVSAYTETGLNTVNVAQVATFGDGSVGILAESDAGDVSVSVDSLRTTGAASHGIFADSFTGDVKIELGKVRTEGLGSLGVIGYSQFGRADVDVTSVETMRDESIGVFVGGGIGADVNVGKVLTSGYGAIGVQMVAGNYTEDYTTIGEAVLNLESVETRGFEAVGVSVVAIGAAKVNVGAARTYGEDSDGVSVYSRWDDSTIEVGSVHTSGARSSGIYAGTEEADLKLRLGQAVTEGDSSSAIQISARYGSGDVLVTGDLTTSGDGSRGVITSANAGDMKVLTQGVIQTRGAFAQGIYTATIGRTVIGASDIRTLGDYSVGIEAWSAADAAGTGAPHSIDIVSGSITTAGAESHGIKATNAETGFVITDDFEQVLSEAPAPAPRRRAGEIERDITIRSGAIGVTGEGAKGILVDGAEDVTIEANAVSSRLDDALSIAARANASVTLTGAIKGGDAGADIKGENVSITIAKTGVVTGATDAIVLAAVGPYVPPPTDGGGVGPFGAASPGVATLNNAGMIIGGTTSAIRVTAGTANLTNSGRIEGSLIFADGDDRVVNSGTLLINADSDFGAGDDLFTNSGVVQLGKSAAPLNVRFLGLERFANDGGLVDLRNERAGDVLTLGGSYIGTSKARVALDVSGLAVDSLVVAGAATGKTTVQLQGLKDQNATLMAKPLTLIRVGAGSAADAFQIENADHGLVRYDLSFSAATNAYQLDASAGLAVHQTLRAGEGLQAAWRASAEAFNSEQSLARAAGGERGRVWAQAFGGAVNQDGDDEAFSLDYDQDLVGGQMGFAFGKTPLAGGDAVVGVTAGYVDSTLSFAGAGQDIDLQTLNIGAYGIWNQASLFATGLVKVDYHEVSIEDRAAGFEADLDGLSWGAQLEAGYRLDFGGFALEPVIGLDYASTTLDDLETLGQSVIFDDRNGLSARVGTQAFTRRALSNGRAVVLSAGLEAVHAFDADQSGTLISGGQSDSITIDGPESFGRAMIGAQFEVSNGLQTYVQGEGRFGDGQSGGGVRIGARFRF